MGFLRKRPELLRVDVFVVSAALPVEVTLLAAFFAEAGTLRTGEGLAAFLLVDCFVATGFFAADLRAGALRGADFFVAAVLGEVLLAAFFVGARFSTVFFAFTGVAADAFVAFLTAAFFCAAGFFTTDLLAADFRVTVDFFVAALRAGVALAFFAVGVFLSVAFFATLFVLALPVFLLVFFVAMMFPQVRIRRHSILEAFPYARQPKLSLVCVDNSDDTNAMDMR